MLVSDRVGYDLVTSGRELVEQYAILRSAICAAVDRHGSMQSSAIELAAYRNLRRRFGREVEELCFPLFLAVRDMATNSELVNDGKDDYGFRAFSLASSYYL